MSDTYKHAVLRRESIVALGCDKTPSHILTEKNCPTGEDGTFSNSVGRTLGTGTPCVRGSARRQLLQRAVWAYLFRLQKHKPFHPAISLLRTRPKAVLHMYRMVDAWSLMGHRR